MLVRHATDQPDRRETTHTKVTIARLVSDQ